MPSGQEELTVVKLLIGQKLGMTQVFDPAGTVTPVTVLELGPCEVVQLKTEDRDGYRAAQLGFRPQTAKRVRKPQIGHFKKAGLQPYRFLKEAPLAETAGEGAEVKVGDRITVDAVFEAGELVDVIGTTKGRGFAGTIKRYGFSRGPMSHGSKNIREPGSTGAHTYPGRVFKGKKMPGQMGAAQRTVKNLEVVEVDAERHRLLVKGAVPGAIGGTVYVRHAKTPPPAKKGVDKKS
jgi:large subunit ribosomal protein L3